jgi:DNA-binding LacI/PurR family transcriptional regulator
MSDAKTARRRPAPPRLPTIRDVARLAGVGKTTVSDALQGRGRVAPETRERILAAVEQLGYRANLGARDLTRQRTEVIGVVVGDFFDPFSAELTGRLERHAAANGFRVLLSTAGADLRHEASAIGSLLEYRVAALVLVAFTGDEQELLAIGAHTPVVCIGYEGPCGVSIGIDDKRGGDVATAHLVELGHARIAYVSAKVLPRQTDADRLAGYRRALRRGGLGSDRALVHRFGPGPEEARRAQMRALLTQPDRPTAVFAASDITAIELMSCADELGLRVPEDLSVVGFDDIALARVPMLALTTVAQPIAELAQRGVDAAIALIEDPAAAVQGPRIEPQLVVRGTTAPPAG